MIRYTRLGISIATLSLIKMWYLLQSFLFTQSASGLLNYHWLRSLEAYNDWKKFVEEKLFVSFSEEGISFLK